jgi:hypothetical protein
MGAQESWIINIILFNRENLLIKHSLRANWTAHTLEQLLHQRGVLFLESYSSMVFKSIFLMIAIVKKLVTIICGIMYLVCSPFQKLNKRVDLNLMRNRMHIRPQLIPQINNRLHSNSPYQIHDINDFFIKLSNFNDYDHVDSALDINLMILT